MEYGISGYQTDYRFMKKEVIQLAHETVPLTGTEQVDQIYLLGTIAILHWLLKMEQLEKKSFTQFQLQKEWGAG